MSMATAVAGSSFTVLRSSCALGAGVQGLRSSHQKVSPLRLQHISAVCKLDASMDSIENQVAVGGSTLAGALFAAMAASDSAMAAQQMMALASDDNRGLALLLPLVPAIGWVLFNILQPGLNQLNNMRGAKAVVAGAGLGALATFVAAPHASAAQEIVQLADSDSRGLVLLGILAPAVGWVLFNILQPALNQLNKMRSAKGVIGALGLGAASMLLPSQADAVQEIATIADSDSRGLVLLGILIPAVGWVLFNILQPGLNQLDKMRSTKGLIGAAGLGAAAASLIAVPNAEAAQEITQLAVDSRPLILLFILAPAVGWVLFNILQPALNQLNKMRSGK